MPAAAIPIIGAIAGGAGSAASGVSGKKAQSSANKLAQQQLQLQQNQFGLAKQQTGLGNAALAPASNWYQDLLKGGVAAQQATGPYASLIGQQGQGTRNAIMAGTPRGGEQNLALAENSMQTGNNIARLYAGMQPLAAQGLGQLGGEYFSSGASFNPSANTGGAFGQYGLGQQMAGQAGQGFGNLLYNSLNKIRNGSLANRTATSLGSGGGYGAPPTGFGIGAG